MTRTLTDIRFSRNSLRWLDNYEKEFRHRVMLLIGEQLRRDKRTRVIEKDIQESVGKALEEYLASKQGDQKSHVAQ